VILSNETDASFCRDFSILLDRVRCEWVVLDRVDIPAHVRDNNLIIIGGLDAEYTGDIIKEFLTQKEVDYIQDGHYSILLKDNPWADNTIYICTGPDRILTKKAAEEAIMSLDGEWVYPPFSSVPREEALAYLTQIQYIPDEELPIETLKMEIDPKTPEYISAEEALKDVEYLFYLFSHGYCGYKYFMAKGDFDEAKKSIVEELEKKSTWSPDDVSQVIHDNLTFIHDCHLTVGVHKYGSHKDFWYDTTLELSKSGGNYYFTKDTTYEVVSINGEDPEPFMFPSLNVKGDPIYRIGTLSHVAPEPLVLTVYNGHEQHIELPLYRSDFTYFSQDIFQEDTIGGIPVVRIRSFSDHHADALDHFMEAAETYKGAPCLIIDIRGNGGGNEKWPKTWITQFTGSKPSNKRYFTELISKTTMMGRANYFEYLLDMYPDVHMYQTELDHFTAQANLFEKQYTTPHWSGPFSEGAQVIPNDTTLIVVTNGTVGSAAEGFIIYISQVENVVFVGENTRGAVVFGQMTRHRLPHSKLLVHLPISLNIPLDLELREEIGFFPDVWVPAKDAVNYAVAAVRKQTITTVNPLPEEVLQQEFIPEDPLKAKMSELLLPGLFLTVLGIIPALVNRKRGKKFFFILGAIWVIAGIIILSLLSPIGYVYSLLGIVYIAIGVYKWKTPGPTPQE
jgi:hypothetical protein